VSPMINKTFYSIFQKGSKTYFYSSLFFPTNVKKDVFQLYAFVRKADNYVDQIPQNIKGFYHFKNQYYSSLQGTPSNDLVIDAFVDLIHKRNLEHTWIDAFFNSMEMDITKNTYNSFPETLTYIYGSAEVIGLMMSKIMQLPKKADNYAQYLGRAMQYINFIRDIAEDNTLQRNYFPKTELTKYGLTTLTQQEAHQKPEAFNTFIRAQIQRYCRWQQVAEQGYKYIPKRYLISVKTASEMYHWTAEQIYKKPSIIFEWKVKPLITQIITTTLINLIDPKKPNCSEIPCPISHPNPQPYYYQ